MKAKRLATVCLLLLLLVCVIGGFLPQAQTWTPEEEQEYENQQWLYGIIENDTRLVFGDFLDMNIIKIAELANPSKPYLQVTVEEYQSAIENFFIPHNIYWICVWKWEYEISSPNVAIYRFLNASYRYGIRVVFQVPYFDGSETYWWHQYTATSRPYLEVNKNAVNSSSPVRLRFDYKQQWIEQWKEDWNAIKTQYQPFSDHIYGCYWYTEYFGLSTAYYAYDTWGYSNQTLANYTSTSDFTSDINATTHKHGDGSLCKLWEMFVNQSATYNTTTLYNDCAAYHDYMRDYRGTIVKAYCLELANYINPTFNPNGISFLGYQLRPTTPYTANGLVCEVPDTAQWDYFSRTKNELVGPNLITKVTERKSQGYAPLFMQTQMHRTGACWISPDDYVWMYTRAFPPRPVPLILMYCDFEYNSFWDIHKEWADLFNRIKWFGWLVQEEAKRNLAKILWVQTGLNGHYDPGIQSVEWLLSLGLNVTVTTNQTAVLGMDLSQFDTIIWGRYYKWFKRTEVGNKLYDAVNNLGVGLVLLGDAYTDCPDQYGLYGFDSIMANITRLKYDDYAWYTASSWSFVNDHTIFAPYGNTSLALTDFITPTKHTYNYTAYHYKHLLRTDALPFDGTVLIQDNAGYPVFTVRTQGNGRVAWFGWYDTDCMMVSEDLSVANSKGSLGSWTKALTVLTNTLLWTGKKDSLIPLLWFNDNNKFVDGLVWSTSGGKGNGLLWLSLCNETSTAKTLSWNFRPNILNLGSNWVAVDLRSWQTWSGSGNVSLSLTMQPKTWAPIFITNKTSNLYDIYTNAYVVSRNIGSTQAKYTLRNPYNQSSWLVIRDDASPVSVSTNSTLLSEQSSISTLNSLSTLSGWYYNSTTKILYVKFRPTSAVEITINQQTPPPPPPPSIFATQTISDYNATLASSGLPFIKGGTNSITFLEYLSNKLTFTVSGSSGTTSTTTVYVADKGQPVQVIGATTYTFNSTTKIETLNVLHSSSATVTLDWTRTSDVPTTTYTLTVKVIDEASEPQYNARVTARTQQGIILQSKTTDLTGTAKLSLSPGTYLITAEKNGLTATATVALDKDKTVTLTITAAPTAPLSPLTQTLQPIIESAQQLLGPTIWTFLVGTGGFILLGAAFIIGTAAFIYDEKWLLLITLGFTVLGSLIIIQTYITPIF